METLSASNISDNEGEDEVAPIKMNNNYKSLLDSDSSEDENQNVSSKISDDGDSDENVVAGKSMTKKRLVTSDSEEEEVKAAPVKDRRKNSNPKKKILPVKTQRKSASKAMEVIKEKMTHKKQVELKQEIQSEKQRMEREQEIRVPYHKPRQFTLQEFLARKSLNKPLLQKNEEGHKPMSSILALKMLSQNIEAFAQQMKKREEEAIEFFRSESESDDDDEPDKENKFSNLETKGAVVKDEDAPGGGEIVDDSKIVKDPETVDRLEVLEEKTVEVTEAPDVELQDDKPMDQEANKHEKILDEPEMEMHRLREKYKNQPKEEPQDVKPKLSFSKLKTLEDMGSNDFVIDLETGGIEPRKLSGPEMLFQRYLKSVQKPKHKESVCMNILTVENGKLENQKIEYKLDKEIELDHQKPGFSREKFKASLRDKIMQERLGKLKEKMAQKKELEELEPEDKEDCTMAEDEINGAEKDPEENDSDVEEEEEEEDDEDEIEQDIDLDKSRKKSKKMLSQFLDEEAVDEDASEDELEDDESSSSSEDEEVEETTSGPKKSRILKVFEDSDDEDNKESRELIIDEKSEGLEEIDGSVMEPVESQIVVTQDTEDLRPANKNVAVVESEDFDPFAISQRKHSDDPFSSQPSDFTFTEPSVSEEQKTTGIDELCDVEPSQLADDDLLDICSGQFAITQVDSAPVLNSEPVPHDAQELDFDDSEFVSQVAESTVDKASSPVKNTRKLLESTDDEAVDGVKEKRKKKLKKRKQKVKRLGFSDDEDDEVPNAPTDDDEIVEDEEDNLEECEEEEEAEVLVDYDSEENEIEVKLNKNDRIKAAGKYFENEAELSESEWGSADEDEKDLDKFDIELGDEEQFDQHKLQEEVGRIHARKVLDDDIKQQKRIESLLFEDEENDGVGRERKFRWKNQPEGFLPENENAMDANLAENDDSDGESEIAWRKMRHERETFLSEQSMKMTDDTMSEDTLFLDPNSQMVSSSSTSMMAKRKFRFIKTDSMIGSTIKETAKKESPFLIKMVDMKKYKNASFLNRGDDALSRIASFLSRKDDEVTNVSSHNSNSMSFMTIDKPEETKKRKSDTNNLPEPNKKRKVSPEGKTSLLDQL